LGLAVGWVPLRLSLSLSLSLPLSDAAVGWVRRFDLGPSQMLALSLRRFDLLVPFFFLVFWLFSVLVVFWGVILFGDFGCGREEMVVEHFFSIEISVLVMAGR
jgi:hypothetical protein